VPTSWFVTAADPVEPVSNDRAPGAGGSPELTATVLGRDGCVVFTVSRHLDGNRAASDELVVAATGDLDHDTAPLVEVAVATALDQSRRVCLDLRDVAFFGAAGANTVVAAHLHAVRTDGSFTVRNVPGNAWRVLQITGVDTVVAAHP
jgi:anti-anti-sigma factor